MDRAAAIEKSLAAYTHGVIGCIPILGLGFAIYALICWSKVRRGFQDWNPAEDYLKSAALLGWLGILLSMLWLLSMLAFLVGNFMVTELLEYGEGML